MKFLQTNSRLAFDKRIDYFNRRLIKHTLFLHCCFLITFIVTAQTPKLILPFGHTAKVNTVRFSPDGKRLVSASDDLTAKIWDFATGTFLTEFRGHTRSVQYAAFSPDGKKIVTASSDSTARIWDAGTGALLITIKEPLNAISSAHFNLDGSKVITVANKSRAKIWAAASGVLIDSIPIELDANEEPGMQPLLSARFFLTTNKLHNESVLIISGTDAVTIWDVKTARLLNTLEGHHGIITSAQLSVDGKYIVTSSLDRTAKVWDVSGKLLKTLKGHTEVVLSAQFSKDGKKIVTAGADSTVRIWDLIADTSTIFKLATEGSISAQFNADGDKLVAVESDSTATVWDLRTNTSIKIKRPPGSILSAQFSPDGNKIITTGYDETITFRDAASGDLLASLKAHTDIAKSAQFSQDGQKMVTVAAHSTAKIWETSTGNLLLNIKTNKYGYNSARFSFPRGLKLVTTSDDRTARIWDAATGAPIFILPHREAVTYADFIGGSRVVAISGTTAEIWDALKGTRITNTIERADRNINNSNYKFSTAQFRNGYNQIITLNSHGDAELWDIYGNASRSGQQPVRIHITDIEKQQLSFYDGFISAQFSPDGKKIITASMNGANRIWDAGSLKLLYVWRPAKTNAQQQSAFFSPDGSHIVAAFRDGAVKIIDSFYHQIQERSVGNGSYLRDINFHNNRMIATKSSEFKLFDLNTGNLLVSFYSIDSTGYLKLIPGGYYEGTPDAAKLLHYITNDSKIISFEQLDVKYNRPDKVLQAMGCSDTILINSYRKAYQKRIKKLGIDTTAFRDGYSVPEADFANRDKIAFEQKNNILSLKIKGRDGTYHLDRFNVWVNEVPVFGQKGISIRKRNSLTIDTVINIQLSYGENRIETSVINANGTESYRSPLLINYTPLTEAKSITHFIGIGIDRFSDSRHNLRYCSKDIRDLALKMKQKTGDHIIIDTLFNEMVTTDNIKELKKKLLQTTVNDKVIISYSGHGQLSDSLDYYLSTYTINFNRPEENGLRYDELENLLDSIPARKKLLLLDACHSGEVDKEEYQQMKTDESEKTQVSNNSPAANGLEILDISGDGPQKMGLKNSFELMQHLFVNVGKSTGAIVISAASGTESALEKGELKNGLFTFCIMDALDNKNFASIKISELKKIVSTQVEALSHGLQKPGFRNETIATDWMLFDK